MASNEPPPESAAVVVHFIRHGEVFNPESIFYGRLPGFHLSETGFREARKLGVDLAQVRAEIAATHGFLRTSALLHSPMLRARETAEVLAASHPDHSELAQHLEVEADLIEVNVPYERKPIKELIAMSFELYSHGREQEGFETFPDVVRRVHGFVDRLRHSCRHRGTQVIAVCHGDICLAARMLALMGAQALLAAGPNKNQPSWLPYPDHCSMTSICMGAGLEELDRPRWLNKPAGLGAATGSEEEAPPRKRQRVATIAGNVEIAANA